MKRNFVSHLYNRLFDAWRRKGPLEFAFLIAKNLRALPGELLRRYRISEFDRDLGIDTDQIQWVGELGLDSRSESTRNAKWYAPTDFAIFDSALATIDADLRGFTFVDYGSGKGRVLILAARQPFLRVIGIELSASLHALAEENIRRAATRTKLACTDVRSIHADAIVYIPPQEPLICYFFNPFEAPIMRQVIECLTKSLIQKPRPMFIVYVNPQHASVVEDSSYFAIIEKNASFCTYRFQFLRP